MFDKKFIRWTKAPSVQYTGCVLTDFLDLYRKFTYTNQERYTFDCICKLGERKDAPFDTFEWYQKDYQSFIEYNITDVELVDKLEDKMRLIELCLTMMDKVNFTDVLGQVRYWDNVIYNHLRKKKIVIHRRGTGKVEQFEVLMSRSLKSTHKWVMSFDLNSCIRTLLCNIIYHQKLWSLTVR